MLYNANILFYTETLELTVFIMVILQWCVGIQNASYKFMYYTFSSEKVILASNSDNGEFTRYGVSKLNERVCNKNITQSDMISLLSFGHLV